MLNSVGLSCRNACEEIKGSISPELRKKIEDKKLFNNDILAIARSVLVKEEIDGSFSIEKCIQDRNVEVPLEQQELIRRICSLEQRRAEVQIVRREKKQKEEEPQTKISKVEDLFYIGAPAGLLGLIAEYMPETPFAIIDFVNNKNPIPQYLKDNLNHLDLSKNKPSLETFKGILSEFKNLRSIELPKCANDLYIDALKVLPKLEGLDLNFCKNVTDTGIDKAIQWFTGLKYLNLSHTRVTDKGLINIKLSRSLQTLNLEDTNISGEFLSHINQEFESLRKFDITSCRNFKGSNLTYIVGKFPILEEFYISNNYFENEDIELAIKGAKKLESLSMSRLDVRDEGLKCIANECPNLKKLDISICKNITESGINSIFSSCLDFEELNANYCNVNDRWFDGVAEKSSKIIKLSLHNCQITDEGIKSISKGCPNLRSISLRHCTQVTDLGISYLVQGVKTLYELDMVGNNNISSLTLDYILNWRESLQLLDLTECSRIDNDALLHLLPGLLFLKSLDLVGNKNISDKVVLYFAKMFPRLESLDLSHTNITNESLQNLKKLQKLSHLKLDWSNITGEGIDQFFDFPALDKLSLAIVTVISDSMTIQKINKLRSNGIQVQFAQVLKKL